MSINIALVLGACMKPVGAGSFPKEKQSGVGVNVNIENPEDIPPELKVIKTSETVGEGKAVNLSDEDIIEVTNAADYESVEWYYNSTQFLTGVSGEKGETLTVDTSVAPFKVAGRYSFAVVGIIGDKRYSILFFINVGS